MKRILSVLLALTMLLSLLTLFSCSKEEKKTTETGSDIEVIPEETKEDPNDIYDADVKNLHEHNFKFIVRDVAATHLTTNEVYAEALNGEAINDAVYKRNSQLENQYNIKITEERSTDVTGTYRAALTAGEYVADVIYEKLMRAATLTTAGLLCDISNLDNINLQKNWWDHNFNDAMGLGGKKFYVVGDATTMDERSTWVIMFNKDRITEVGLEVPYEAVFAGDWTVDLMYEYMQKTTADKNGDGAIKYGDDYTGYVAEIEAPFAHSLACNTTLCSFDDKNVPFLTDTINDSFMNAWTKVKPLLTTESYYCSDANAEFKKGLVTFYGINSACLILLNNSMIEFGVMPFPKMNKDQTNYCNPVMGTTYAALCIPASAEFAEDAKSNGFENGCEQAAYLLEAYAYASRDTLTIAYYDQVLLRQSCKDPESRKMIEMAFTNKVYDPVHLIRWGNIAQNMFTTCSTPKGQQGTDAKWNNLQSSYEADLPKARTEMQAYLDYIESMA